MSRIADSVSGWRVVVPLGEAALGLGLGLRVLSDGAQCA